MKLDYMAVLIPVNILENHLILKKGNTLTETTDRDIYLCVELVDQLLKKG